MFWQGTAHWEQLLPERAKISGNLVITPRAQKEIRDVHAEKINNSNVGYVYFLH